MHQFGYSPEEVINGEVTIFNTILPEDLSNSLAEVEKLPTNSPRMICTHRFITKDGRERHLFDMLRFSPVNESGVGECKMVAIDITEWVDLIQKKVDAGWPNLPLNP